MSKINISRKGIFISAIIILAIVSYFTFARSEQEVEKEKQAPISQNIDDENSNGVFANISKIKTDSQLNNSIDSELINPEPEPNPEPESTSPQCDISKNEIIFYYLKWCSWCNKVKDEGTILKLEALGVKVKQVDAEVGPVEHEFQTVPTFVINDKLYSGYKTFEELEKLLNCSVNEKNKYSN